MAGEMRDQLRPGSGLGQLGQSIAHQPRIAHPHDVVQAERLLGRPADVPEGSGGGKRVIGRLRWFTLDGALPPLGPEDVALQVPAVLVRHRPGGVKSRIDRRSLAQQRRAVGAKDGQLAP